MVTNLPLRTCLQIMTLKKKSLYRTQVELGGISAVQWWSFICFPTCTAVLHPARVWDQKIVDFAAELSNFEIRLQAQSVQ
jgi:hypothetical protein